MMRRFLFATAIALLPLTAQVRHEDIVRGPNESWLTYAGDYGSRRHSPLDQIRRVIARYHADINCTPNQRRTKPRG